MADAVIRAPRDPEPKPAACPVCRLDVPARAQKCGHCGEWLVPSRLNGVDALLQVLGYVWAILSIIGAIGMWLMSNVPTDTNVYGPSVPPSFWASLPTGVIVALLLQGLVIGFGIVSFARRGPREWAA